MQKLLTKVRRAIRGRRDRWSPARREKAAMQQYKKAMGYAFDLKNPRLFTEKVVWYKLFYDHKDLNRIVDKYLFKEYIREKLGEGYTIPLYGAYTTIDALREGWKDLPEEFVLKSTLMSDGKGIKVIRHKSRTDLDALCAEAADWLNPYGTLINSFCRAYYGTTPRLIAEKYESEVGDQLYDYKVFCFDGKPTYFYVAIDHFPGQLSKISFYDLDWKRLDVRYGKHPNNDVPRPENLSEMLALAEKLSAGFPFMRVDFFQIGGRAILAELTLYPGGGLTPITPESFNRELGDLFVLPETTLQEGRKEK